jgi:hypothetical protein
MEKYTPQTDKEKIEYLMSTDGRREKHIGELQKDVKELTKSVNNLTTAIIGSPLNKKTGFIDLFDTLDKKVDIVKKEVEYLNKFQSTIQPQFNVAKWVFILIASLSIATFWNMIVNPKTDKQITETTK